MTRRKTCDKRSAFEAKIALAAHVGEHTVVEIAEQHDVHPAQV